MSDTSNGVAHFKWGPADLSGTADTTEFTLTDEPNGDLLILLQDMAPQPQKRFGAYDFKQSMSIAADDIALFVATLLGPAIEGEGPPNWDQLQDLCKEWDGPFSASGRAIP